MKNNSAKAISDIVNKFSFDPKVAGTELSTDHRYLQGEFFKCSLAFIANLANNYRKGIYDGRNEFACKAADVMMRGLEESDLYHKEFEDGQYKEILEDMWK